MAVPPKFLAAVAAASKKYGVPADLLAAQIQGESGWRPDAKSPAGALGISQFMPGTAKGYGINPLDPIASIDAQGKMMGKLLKSYNGNVAMALAGYNAGSGAVAKYHGVPPFAETQKYIKNVQSYRKNYPGLAAGNVAPDAGTTALPLPDGTASTVAAPAGPSLLPVTNVGPRTTPTAQGVTGGLTAGSFMEAALQTLGVKRHSSLGAQEARTSAQTAGGVAPVSLLPLPDGTPSTVTAPTMPGKETKLTPGGGWEGSQALATSLADIAEGLGLKATSQKRSTKLTASGNPSDHWTGSKGSYAYDLSNGVKTPQEDKSATAIAAALGVKDYHGGSWLNVTKNGYRYQVGWRVPGHYDHVHVGVRKL